MKLIEKFKKQPLPVKLLGGMILSWVYPFIESMMFGNSGFGDFTIISLILLSIGGILLAYLLITHLFIPVGKKIGKIFTTKKK